MSEPSEQSYREESCWEDSVTEPNCFPTDAAVQVPTKCALYLPGHGIHQIQMRRALSEAGWETVTEFEVREGTVRFQTDEGRSGHSGWNHDPQQLQTMWDLLRIEPGAFASWCPKYQILMVSIPGLPGTHAVHLGDQKTACSPRLGPRSQEDLSVAPS